MNKLISICKIAAVVGDIVFPPVIAFLMLFTLLAVAGGIITIQLGIFLSMVIMLMLMLLIMVDGLRERYGNKHE